MYVVCEFVHQNAGPEEARRGVLPLGVGVISDYNLPNMGSGD